MSRAFRHICIYVFTVCYCTQLCLAQTTSSAMAPGSQKEAALMASHVVAQGSEPSGSNEGTGKASPVMPERSSGERAGSSSLNEPNLPAPDSVAAARLTGKITDLTGTTGIPGARVLLIKEDAEHVRREVETNDDGTFILENLEPGSWEMTISAPERLSYSEHFVLKPGETRSVNVSLEELEAEDVMRITGKRTLVHPEQIGSRTNVMHDTVYQYRSGNNLHELVETTPGVVTDTFGNIIVRGEHNAVNYVLDDVILPESAGVLQQSNFVTPRSLQSFAMDIGGYQASDGGGPLGAVARLKSLPISAVPTLTAGQQLGAPLAGNVYYNSSGAFSQNSNSRLNRLRFESSGNFIGTSLGPAPPVKSFTHNGRADINVLSKLEYQATENDRIKLTVGINESFLQVPTNHTSLRAGVKQHQHDRQDFAILSYKHRFERFFDEANLHLINAFYYQSYNSKDVFDPLPVINGGQPLVSMAPHASRFNYIFGSQGNVIKTFMNTHRLDLGYLTEVRPVTTNFSSLYFNNDPTNPNVPLGAIISPFTGDQTAPSFINGLGKFRGFRYLQSAYFQDSWRPTTGFLKRFTVDAGVRFDLYHGVFGNTQRVAQTLLTIPGIPDFSPFPFNTQKVTNAQASGRFGGAFVLTPKTVLRGSFSNLFMPPPVDVFSTPPDTTSFFNGVFNGTVRPMQATRGRLVDTSVEQQLGSRFMTRTNLFYKVLSNFGDSGVIGNSPLYNRQTVAGQEAYGVETRVEFRPNRDGYGVNAFLSNTFQIALLRATKQTTGGIYNIQPAPILSKYPDHDRRESVVAGLGYMGRRNWWVLADYKFMSGLQDQRNPAIFGPHPARTPLLNVFGLSFGFKAPRALTAHSRLIPDTLDCRIENLFNNRLATNLGSPFQGTRYLLPFRFLIGCSWHVGKQQYKFSQSGQSTLESKINNDPIRSAPAPGVLSRSEPPLIPIPVI